MDWLEFLASVIGSLAWPAAIAFIVWVLRNPLRSVIGALRKVGFRGWEAEFGERVLEAEVAAKGSAALRNVTAGTALANRLSPEISTAPRAAVIEAWLEVERELEALAQRVDLPLRPDRRWTPEPIVRQLVEREVIDPGTASVILDLRHARNLAAHDQSFRLEHDEVINYVRLAGRVSAALRANRRRVERRADELGTAEQTAKAADAEDAPDGEPPPNPAALQRDLPVGPPLGTSRAKKPPEEE